MVAIIFVLVALGIPTCFAIYSVIRRNNQQWIGVLQNKKIITYYSKRKKTKYRMCFDSDLGKKVVFDVNEATYNSINIGDRVQKSKGQFEPTRIL